ncbi:Bacterial Ig-like domain (group 2) [Vibrio mediterranei]|uniref:Ig-like domain-containing protein n=2 Tax=Vibrio mediterranei TaxID=689 RepID=UPI000782DAF7|nr:Ig-like domain-containing protein [Vibrio mediterranei]MCG9656816.1 Ig-like domain-containing protein [Vibrio mediterranei]SBO10783.1 Bacterial Ig-like domain (group 2) [Vibrio mediterranei]
MHPDSRNKKKMKLFSILLLVLIITGCGSEKTPGDDNGQKILQSISIMFEQNNSTGTLSYSIPIGHSKQLIARGLYDDGSTVDITSVVSWSSSNQTVATVDKNGLLKAKEEGSSLVTAQFDGIRSNALSVTVSAAELQELQVTPGLVSLTKGATQQLKAEAFYNNGSSRDVTESVRWQSSNGEVATVDLHGMLKGTEEGSSLITAQLEGIRSNTVTVTVTSSGEELTPIEDALKTGDHKKVPNIELFYDEILAEVDDKDYGEIGEAVWSVISKFSDQSFSFDTRNCPHSNRNECDIEGFNEEFFNYYQQIVEYLVDIQSVKQVRIFEVPGYRLERLLVLLGDKLREEVAFPMFAHSTDTYTFIGALLSDGLNYDLRALVYPQNDLGINNSAYNLAELTAISTRLLMVNNGVPVSAYAIPGQEVTVINNSEQDVYLAIGRHMWNSTTPFDQNRLGYSRPSDFALQASWTNGEDELVRKIIVPSGSSEKFNSSTGGNVWVVGKTPTGSILDLELQNIALGSVVSPYSNEIEINTFKDSVNREVFPYYIFSTDNSNDVYHHQVYKDLFENEPVEKLLSDADWFSQNYPAYGYRHGENVRQVSGIQGFVTGLGLDMDAPLLDYVQSFYYPTDVSIFSTSSFNDPVGSSYGKFAPTNTSPASHTDGSLIYGHLNFHEKAHIFQDNDTQFMPWRPVSGTEATVNLIAWSLTYEYNKNHYEAPDFTEAQCWSNIHFDDFIIALGSAYQTDDPHQAMVDHWNEKTGTYFRGQYNIFLQMMVAADKTEGSTAEFNQLFQRTSIMHRNLREALESAALWDSRAQSLGFAGLNREDVKDWELNDILYVLFSSAASLDYYDLLHGLGVVIGQDARDHVRSASYTIVDAKVYDISDCKWATPPLFTRDLPVVMELKKYENVALGKPVTASSYNPNREPYYATDGSYSTHTETTNKLTEEWIEVDLGYEHNLDSISVVNFNHSAYWERFSGTEVHGFNSKRELKFESGKLNAMDRYSVTSNERFEDIQYIRVFKTGEDNMVVQTSQIEAVIYDK